MKTINLPRPEAHDRRRWLPARRILPALLATVCCLATGTVRAQAAPPGVGRTPPGSCLAARSASGLEAPPEVTIPLPEGLSMRFRAVYLGIDGSCMFNSRRVRLGSATEPGYKGEPTEAQLSGAFVGTRNGRLEWLYYLGETEVQEGQWNAILRWWDARKGRPQRPQSGSRLPKTAVTVAEIQELVDALSVWMLSQHRDKLPAYRRALAFPRLPTEAEWEFAARGGVEILESDKPALFDEPQPYGDALGNHEWVRGNAGKRPQDCGSPHIKPNPLGLYDMLGNVEELTLSLFGPEYLQGRFGQLVVRGGNFSTGEKDISAAHRTEGSFFDPQGGELRNPKVGLRLALSTRISDAGMTPDELAEQWDWYAASRGLTRPGPAGQSSPAAQAEQDRLAHLEEQLYRRNAEIERLRRDLDGVEDALAKAGGPDTRQAIERQHQERLSAKDADLAHLAAQQQAQNAELARLKAEREDLQGRIDAQRAAAEKAHAEAVAAERARREQADQIARREREVTELRRQLDARGPQREGEALRERLARIEADNERLARELARSGGNTEAARTAAEAESQRRRDLDDRLARAQGDLAQASARERELASRLAQSREEIERLRERPPVVPAATNMGRAEDEVRRLSARLGERDRDIADLRRQVGVAEHEIGKNAGRVRAVEKRYLEALMRQASANAHYGWRTLTKLREWPREMRGDEGYAKRNQEATQFVRDYWELAKQIASETQPDLFPEVKKELADWLRAREEPGAPGRQRKSLDLLQRHVADIRAGRYHRPEDLVRSFPDEPEMK